MPSVRSILTAAIVLSLTACGGGASSPSTGSNQSSIPTATAPADTWTWAAGANTANGYATYGTQGTAAPGNVPGVRQGINTWEDSAGKLWLFGGAGFDVNQVSGVLADLWRFDPSTGEWTWINGSSSADAVGVYGTLGTAAAANLPGARENAAAWTDASGDFWLFGGEGYDSAGNYSALNDLWKFNPSTDQWTWIGGSPTVSSIAVYGVLGRAASTNQPGAREFATAWIDAAGNLWLFGGLGYDAAGDYGSLNDLWKFTPGTGEWAWISGGTIANAVGVYGTQGIATAASVPGGRAASASWIDAAGNLWLFGGAGYDSTGTNGDLNDLWEFNPSTGEWMWVSGSGTANVSGVYGNEGSASAANAPGGREAPASWIDASGNLWLYGGGGYDSVGANSYLNDLWEFSKATGQWIWVNGSPTANAVGVYGTVGTGAGGNTPGARLSAGYWTDAAGNLWLFGGLGIDASGNFGDLNDLWKYTP